MRKKILIVDDVVTNIRILARELREEYEIVVATTGEDALKRAYDNFPDLILLDVMMPDMDGYEVCSRLKDEQKTKDIPVIFVTAKNDEEEETRGFSLGAVDYITKPFRLSIVKARVKNHLELKHHRDILENLSSLDGLTGIYNRRRFEDSIDLEWRQAARKSEPLALVMIDIDCFKLYNDNYGHLHGDDCLKRVAQVLKASLRRSTDMVARYGGEEFVAILPKTDMDGAYAVAKAMLKNIQSMEIVHGYSKVSEKVTISLGVASITPALHTPAALIIEAADKALYEAKQRGRNQIRKMKIEFATATMS